ncbi:YifB family Mg chelatase-like AAA ATPase [Halorhodospira halochloris]|uniref:YifB family Mg chelatase-like AAA ATPase n=1 Tax=Halorhodospira halochloris TaxID=1052 RepID=UPI001EE90B2B|nr:YifB family Mg chelatase-like AAA ATPase [Halorhodospira halochloris]MCG5530308.1 YifB family Mg chelatase-like AAA ATPase [Halorhodospira halochloris]
MTLAIAWARAAVGITAPEVRVEVHIAMGLPSLALVGLPRTEVREARARVYSAITNSGFLFPSGRITVNMAPADLPKGGGRFDLAIAMGILAASGQVNGDIEHLEFVGELTLGGEIRSVGAVLTAAYAAREAAREIVVPVADSQEAALVHPFGTYPATRLCDILEHLSGRAILAPTGAGKTLSSAALDLPDLAAIRGQSAPRRALEVAAAGGLNLLLSGPPGTGKSMLAERLPGLLPDLSEEHALEAAAVRSVSGEGLDISSWRRPQMRAPHHSLSTPALIGGGAHPPAPGEVSLAHRGVLFLDELPELPRTALEALREPLEVRRVTLSRAKGSVTYPAAFQLIAAMNPCPCGHYGDPTRQCRCSPEQVQRYRSKLSGPLLDRFDIAVEVPRLAPHELVQAPVAESSSSVASRVAKARELAIARCGVIVADLDGEQLNHYCHLAKDASELLEQAIDTLGLSPRGLNRLLKVARTIADLAGRHDIDAAHLAEAINLRRGLDSGKWSTCS